MARILIAEHAETTAAYLTSTLRSQGHHITHVDNCLDTWRLSTREDFDILVIDAVMPGVDGFVLAQKALQENPLLQVIFLTGFAAVAMDTVATPVYAPAPVTSRPFHIKEMASRIRHLMGYGYMPQGAQRAAKQENTVVYAEFGRTARASS